MGCVKSTEGTSKKKKNMLDHKTVKLPPDASPDASPVIADFEGLVDHH